MNTNPDRPLILVVEDEIEHAAMIQAAFEYRSVSARVQVVPSGEEAMAYLDGTWPYADRERSPLPTLVVLDHWLPEASGLEILEWIRSHETHQDLPVVVFTACHDPKLEVRCRRLGVHDYKVKPQEFGDLAVAVQEILHDLLRSDSGDLRDASDAG